MKAGNEGGRSLDDIDWKKVKLPPEIEESLKNQDLFLKWLADHQDGLTIDKLVHYIKSYNDRHYPDREEDFYLSMGHANQRIRKPIQTEEGVFTISNFTKGPLFIEEIHLRKYAHPSKPAIHDEEDEEQESPQPTEKPPAKVEVKKEAGWKKLVNRIKAKIASLRQKK